MYAQKCIIIPSPFIHVPSYHTCFFIVKFEILVVSVCIKHTHEHPRLFVYLMFISRAVNCTTVVMSWSTPWTKGLKKPDNYYSNTNMISYTLAYHYNFYYYTVLLLIP